MTRRPTPERLYQAQRPATLERLVLAGMLRDRAEAAIAVYEVRTAEDGRPRDAAYWDAGWHELGAMIPPRPQV